MRKLNVKRLYPMIINSICIWVFLILVSYMFMGNSIQENLVPTWIWTGISSVFLAFIISYFMKYLSKEKKKTEEKKKDDEIKENIKTSEYEESSSKPLSDIKGRIILEYFKGLDKRMETIQNCVVTITIIAVVSVIISLLS